MGIRHGQVLWRIIRRTSANGGDRASYDEAGAGWASDTVGGHGGGWQECVEEPPRALDVHLEAVRERAPAGDRGEVHAAVDLEVQFLEPGARREVRGYAGDASYFSLAAGEADDVHAACDEGLAQLAAQPACRSRDQNNLLGHFTSPLNYYLGCRESLSA